MKILAVGSHNIKDPNKQSQVDHWRIGRPLDELKKHTDWQIDQQTTYIPGFEKYNSLEEFTNEELEKALENIGKYDIVISSYHADIAGYLLLQMAKERYGTQFILDVDDDMFAINEDNPYWSKMDDEKTWRMQAMIRHNDWICTTTDYLAGRFRERRRKDAAKHKDDSVFVVPNYISDAYNHPGVDNKTDIYIGYFGGASHYADLHKTNVTKAVGKIMHENKNLRFQAVAMPVDSYLPRRRYELLDGKRGTLWLTDVFPKMKMDIAVAPLLDNTFNKGKSDIKWQESTRAGAVVVASNEEPYKYLPKDTISLVENTEDSWYKALKELVDSKEKRTKQLKAAQKHLKTKRLEDNWHVYKEMFEKVKASK